MLNGIHQTSVRENHIAEEMANGKVGIPNRYGRYFTEVKTLNG